MDGFRAFLAIWLPEGLRSRLLELAPQFPVAPDDRIAWVQPGALHLTLHFFGRVARSDIPSISTACREVAARHGPFHLGLERFGAFPSRGEPNVIWVGTWPSKSLLALQAELHTRCARFGSHGLAGKTFRPHITLCRAKRLSALSSRRLREALELSEGPEDTFEVRSFDLVQSETGPSGPNYTPLETFSLSPLP